MGLAPSRRLSLCSSRRGLGSPASPPPPRAGTGAHHEPLSPWMGSGGGLGPAGPSPNVPATKQVPALVTTYRHTGTGGHAHL